MIFGAIGIGPENDAVLREKVAFRETEIISFSENLMELGASEVVVLSTCNRSEVYFLDYRDEEEILAQVRDAYAYYFNLSAEEKNHVFYLSGEYAVAHLFKVAAGLQSVIVGEDEILHQLKDAYELALSFKNTGKYFNRLFQQVIKTAKKIKTETKISEIPLSTSYIGFQFLQKQVGRFDDKNIMIIGLGNIGKLFYEYSVDLPFHEIYLVNRTKSVAEQVLKGRGCVLSYEEMRRHIAAMDIIIAATSSPHLIIRKKDIPQVGRPMYFLDMSIPRNIDPEIDGMPHVHVYNIDAFKEIAAENRDLRRRLKEQAGTKIDTAVADYFTWVDQTCCDGVIESLNQSVEEILADYLHYLFKRIRPNEKEKKIISRTFEAALKRTMRNPILSLKAIEDPKTRAIYSDITAELFKLNKRGEQDASGISKPGE